MAEFRFDQATPGAGVPGRSRHDLIAGEIITLVATDPVGGGVSYTWEILDKVGSTAALTATTGITVDIGPFGNIVAPCAFLVKLTANDNGTITETIRICSVRGPNTNLRIPLFPETAPTSGTLSSNDPEQSYDNAVYTNLAGLGASAQNWRGWGEWAFELVTLLEAGVGGAPSGPAGGDLAGTYPNPAVAALRGAALEDPHAPADGEILVYADPPGEWQAVAAGASGPAGGDLAGTYPNPSVDGLQGTTVSATSPSDGDVLTFNGGSGEWEPAVNPATAFATFHFQLNGLLSGLSVPTNFEDGLKEVGVAGTISSVHMTQEIDGSGGKTDIELYKVDLAGVETSIIFGGTLSLSAGGGDKSRAVTTSFVGGADVLLSTDRLGIKVTSVQSGPAEDLAITVVMAGNSLAPPAGLPEDNEVTQAINATVLGTNYELVGSVYLPTGTILLSSSRVMLGTDQVGDTADLQIRRFTGGGVIDTISATGVPQDAQPSTNITIPADDWYDLYLRADVGTTNAILRGLKFVYATAAGTRIRQAFDENHTGTTPELVGSVYLPLGTLQSNARCMLGTTAGGTATLELRRFTGGAVVATWTAAGALQDSLLGSSIGLPAADWYDIYLYGDAAPTVAVVKGLDWTVLT